MPAQEKATRRSQKQLCLLFVSLVLYFLQCCVWGQHCLGSGAFLSEKVAISSSPSNALLLVLSCDDAAMFGGEMIGL